VEEGAAKALAAPSLRAAAKQSSVSFPDCHGAEAPRNDGIITCQAAPATFRGKRPDCA